MYIKIKYVCYDKEYPGVGGRIILIWILGSGMWVHGLDRSGSR